jgi:hypothetical protein
MWSPAAEPKRKCVELQIKKLDFAILADWQKDNGMQNAPFEIIHIDSGSAMVFKPDDVDPCMSKWTAWLDFGKDYEINLHDLDRMDTVRMRQLFLVRREYDVNEVTHVLDYDERAGFGFTRPIRDDERESAVVRIVERLRGNWASTHSL